MVKLTWWEEFLIGAAITYLKSLAGTIKNAAELAALETAIAFLEKLTQGAVKIAAD
jgi:hypothetical protein